MYFQPLKVQCHKIFCFRFFSCIIFPQAPENNIGIISNFVSILRDVRKSRCTTGINDTGGKFAAVVNYTGGKLAAGIHNIGCKFCHRYRWCR
jgi:hypothetical protein